MPDYRLTIEQKTARIYPLNFNRDSRNIVNEYLKSNYTGTWLATSAKIDLKQQSSIPILVMSKLDAFRLWQVDFKYNAVVIVTEIATGRLYQHRLYNRSSGETFTGPPFASRMNILPADETSGYFIQENRFFDLLSICRFQPYKGEYAVSIIYFNQVSNKDTLYIESKDKPVRLKKAVNVKTLEGKTPQSDKPLVFSIHKYQNRFIAKCCLKLPKSDDRKVLIGHLLMTTLDRGITARQEVCIPISSTDSKVCAEFEIELGKTFTRRLPGNNRIYLSVNGILSEAVSFNSKIIKDRNW